MNLPESCKSETPPPRLTEREVLDLSGLSKATLSSWKAKNKFPRHLYRTKKYGAIYSGAAVYQALGFTSAEKSHDPFYDALNL